MLIFTQPDSLLRSVHTANALNFSITLVVEHYSDKIVVFIVYQSNIAIVKVNFGKLIPRYRCWLRARRTKFKVTRWLQELDRRQFCALCIYRLQIVRHLVVIF
jgi:hypothetical protein